MARCPLAVGLALAFSLDEDTIVEKRQKTLVPDLSGNGNDGRVHGAKLVTGETGGAAGHRR